MRRFQDLLSPHGNESAVAAQQRASDQLANIVRESRLKWWRDAKDLPRPRQYALIVAAPYSSLDMILLDLLDEHLAARTTAAPVYLANLHDYASVEELARDIPGIPLVDQTPVFAIFDSGTPRGITFGKDARDSASLFVGLPEETLSAECEASSGRLAIEVLRQLEALDVRASVSQWVGLMKPQTRDVWSAAANLSRNQPSFTVSEVSRTVGVSSHLVRAMLNRAAIVHTAGLTPIKKHKERGARRNVYAIDAAVRDAILSETAKQRSRG
jgi:hypothetical protein